MVLYPKYLFGIAGFTPLTWLMFIRADCKDNAPLRIHEGIHQRQMREDGVFKFWYRYLFQARWRQLYEVEAYRAQIAAGGSRHACAAHLAGLYRLHLSFEQAMQLLR